jgi:hypothetical protein
MDAVELIRFQTRQSWQWLNLTLEDVTEEQANWQPPGVANSIAATYAHTIISADEDLNKTWIGRDMFIVGEWKDRAGLSEPFNLTETWSWHDWATRLRVDWQALRAYGAAVEACHEKVLDDLRPEDLERTLDMTEWGLGTWSGLDLMNLQNHHPRIHGGEIACLKGLQGANAWPVKVQPQPGK